MVSLALPPSLVLFGYPLEQYLSAMENEVESVYRQLNPICARVEVLQCFMIRFF